MPSEHLKVWVSSVIANPLWQEWMQEIRKNRPLVPSYRPGMSSEETEALLEKIKFESGRKDGFDFALLHITGEKPNE